MASKKTRSARTTSKKTKAATTRRPMARTTTQTIEPILDKLSPTNLESLVHTICNEPANSAEGYVIAACSLLVAVSHSEPLAHSHHTERLLQWLDANNHPLVPNLLKSWVLASPSFPFRSRVLRYLGRSADHGELRQFLREVARAGQKAPSHHPLADDLQTESRINALHSLRSVRNPDEQDVDVVLACLKDAVANNNLRSLLPAAADVARTWTLRLPLSRLLELAQSTNDPVKLSTLLGIIAEYKATDLTPHAKPILDRLAVVLNTSDNIQQLGLERLVSLGKAVSSIGAINQFAGMFLTKPTSPQVDAIIMACIEAQPTESSELTEAIAGFMRNLGQVREDGVYFRRLVKTVAAGHGPVVASAILRDDSEGYKALRSSRMVRPLFGSSAKLVDSLVNGIDKIDNENSRREIAVRAIRLLWACSLANFSDLPGPYHADNWFNRLQSSESRDKTGWQGVTNHVTNLPQDDSAFEQLACAATRAQAARGTVALVNAVLVHERDFVPAFLEMLIQSAAKGVSDGSPISSLRKSLLEHHSEWLRQNLPRLVVHDGRLNLFAWSMSLDLQSCTHDCAKAAIQNTANAGDITKVIRQFSEASGNLVTIAEQCRFNRDLPDMEIVRQEALKALRARRDDVRKLAGDDLERVLNLVHLTFVLSEKTRIAAYETLESIASRRSIRSLRKRIDSEKTKAGKAAIERALKSIASTLVTEQPAREDGEQALEWLNDVGALGDPDFRATVHSYLNPAHAWPAVLIAALECLSSIGETDDVAIINAFVEDTSADGDVLKAARKAITQLQKRDDREFLEVLQFFYDVDSPVLDPNAVDYLAVLGQSRLASMTDGIKDAQRQWNAHDWDGFVTAVDGLGHLIVKHIYSTHWNFLGLTESVAAGHAKREYAGLLEIGEFKKHCSSLRGHLLALHDYRQMARTAHHENNDGTPKPGVGEGIAEHAKRTFREVFDGFFAMFIAKSTRLST